MNNDLNKIKKDRDRVKDQFDLLKNKNDKEIENNENLEFELQKKLKVVENLNGDLKQLGLKYEDEQRDHEALMNENLNLKKHVVDDEHENEQ